MLASTQLPTARPKAVQQRGQGVVGVPLLRRAVREKRTSHVANVASPEKVQSATFGGVGEASSNIVPLHRTQPSQQQQQQLQHPDGAAQKSTVPMLWAQMAALHGSTIALEDPHKGQGIKVTFREMWNEMQQLAAGMQALGLEKGGKVSLFAENSSRWLLADQAIMLNGCADSVRGSSAPYDELAYILTHSKSSGLVLQDVDALRKLAPALQGPSAPTLKFILVLWGSSDEIRSEAQALGLPSQLPLHSFDELMQLGATASSHAAFRPAPVSRSDLATLVYTSGTTGHPKAVMLSHGNLMYQVENLSFFLPVKAGDSTLSLLPPWHIYERSTSYYILSKGCKQVYSNIRKFKTDLTLFKPDYFVCVPLVLDTLHAKVMHQFKAMQPVRKALVQSFLAVSAAYVQASRVVAGQALRFALAPPPAWLLLWYQLVQAVLAPVHALASKLVYSKVREAVGIQQYIVSGGGSLAPHLDDFYEAIGINVLNGWGLTETSPVLACRRPSQNVRGSIGYPTPGTELRVVDSETLQDLPDGQAGLLLARGPGVMRGYLDDDAATAKAFRAGDGWFDTGDLGWRAPQGVRDSQMAGALVLSGRAKDTIVLASGKKVEPELIEGALTCSPWVQHAVLMGQDKRELGALLFCSKEVLEELEKQQQPQGSLSPTQLEDLLLSEVNALNRKRPDYHAYQHIAHVVVVSSPLSVEDGTLTRTMKPRRPEILKRYSSQVAQLLHRLRG